MESIPTENIYRNAPRPLIIVRYASKYIEDKEQEQEQIDTIARFAAAYCDEYIFIIIGDQSIDEIQFEYPKNLDLPADELEQLKIKILS